MAVHCNRLTRPKLLGRFARISDGAYVLKRGVAAQGVIVGHSFLCHTADLQLEDRTVIGNIPLAFLELEGDDHACAYRRSP